MTSEEKQRLLKAGGLVLHAGGQVVQVVVAFGVMLFGFALSVETVVALAAPDRVLVREYVGLIAGIDAAAMKPLDASMLAPVVIGVRVVLVAVLLVGFLIVNRAWRALDD